MNIMYTKSVNEHNVKHDKCCIQIASPLIWMLELRSGGNHRGFCPEDNLGDSSCYNLLGLIRITKTGVQLWESSFIWGKLHVHGILEVYGQ